MKSGKSRSNYKVHVALMALGGHCIDKSKTVGAAMQRHGEGQNAEEWVESASACKAANYLEEENQALRERCASAHRPSHAGMQLQ